MLGSSVLPASPTALRLPRSEEAGKNGVGGMPSPAAARVAARDSKWRNFEIFSEARGTEWQEESARQVKVVKDEREGSPEDK